MLHADRWNLQVWQKGPSVGAIDLLLGNQQLLDAAACSYVQLLDAAGTLAASSSCTLRAAGALTWSMS